MLHKTKSDAELSRLADTHGFEALVVLSALAWRTADPTRPYQWIDAEWLLSAMAEAGFSLTLARAGLSRLVLAGLAERSDDGEVRLSLDGRLIFHDVNGQSVPVAPVVHAAERDGDPVTVACPACGGQHEVAALGVEVECRGWHFVAAMLTPSQAAVVLGYDDPADIPEREVQIASVTDLGARRAGRHG